MQKENAEINESWEINREIFTVALIHYKAQRYKVKKTKEKHKKLIHL